MRSIWTWTLAALALALVATSARAGTDPKAIAATVAPYLDSQAIAIAHIDLTRIDPDAILAKVFGWGKLDPKEAVAPAMAARKWLADFTGGIGKEAYFVVTMADFGVPAGSSGPVFGFAIVPHGGAVDAQALSRILGPADPTEMKRWGPFDTYAPLGDALFLGSKSTLERLKSAKPVPRPELESAFAAAGDAAVQLVVIPTADMRRVVEEMMPTLPPEIGGAPSTAITHGFLWGAAGLTLPFKAPQSREGLPQGMSLQAVIQSENATQAQALHGVLVAALQALAQKPEVKSQVANAERVITALTPIVEGDRLVLRLGDQQIATVAADALAPIFMELRGQAKQTAAMSNVRQILVACSIYMQNHKGEWPPDLKALDLPPQVLKDPVHPEADVGFVYVKPRASQNQLVHTERVPVLYEAYKEWPAQGIVVGFADTHVERVMNEREFKNMLQGEAEVKN